MLNSLVTAETSVKEGKVNRNHTVQFNDIQFVSVSHAVDLPPADIDGLSDPYCIISVGSESKRTSTVMKSLNPKWEDPAFIFRVAHPSLASRGGLGVSDLVYYVNIDVFDYDRLNQDDHLGRIIIPVAPLMEGKNEVWYKLKAARQGQIVKGKLYVNIVVKSQEVSASGTCINA